MASASSVHDHIVLVKRVKIRDERRSDFSFEVSTFSLLVMRAQLLLPYGTWHTPLSALSRTHTIVVPASWRYRVTTTIQLSTPNLYFFLSHYLSLALSLPLLSPGAGVNLYSLFYSRFTTSTIYCT